MQTEKDCGFLEFATFGKIEEQEFLGANGHIYRFYPYCVK